MMRSNIFAQNVHLIKEKKFNIDCDAFVSHLDKYYKSNTYIYPSALHRVLKINVRMVYSLLEEFAKAGIIKQYLEIYCPNCQRFAGECYKYESVFEVPESVICEHCDVEIEHPLEHAVVIYKVM